MEIQTNGCWPCMCVEEIRYVRVSEHMMCGVSVTVGSHAPETNRSKEAAVCCSAVWSVPCVPEQHIFIFTWAFSQACSPVGEGPAVLSLQGFLDKSRRNPDSLRKYDFMLASINN